MSLTTFKKFRVGEHEKLMIINKSQRQTVSHVGLLLLKPIFSHGQFYVAISKSD